MICTVDTVESRHVDPGQAGQRMCVHRLYTIDLARKSEWHTDHHCQIVFQKSLHLTVIIGKWSKI